MQTISFLLFRLQESGLGSQDILKVVQNHLKSEKKNSFFPFTPRIPPGPDPHEDFCLDRIRMKIFARTGSAKNLLIPLYLIFRKQSKQNKMNELRGLTLEVNNIYWAFQFSAIRSSPIDLLQDISKDFHKPFNCTAIELKKIKMALKFWNS